MNNMSEENKKLYPLKFHPKVRKEAWGESASLVADLGYIETEVSNGWLGDNTLEDVIETYLERIVGDNSYNRSGRLFPVQVKYMRLDGGRMPLMVSPDDEIAGQRYDALGKHKVWYVVEASGDARLYMGLKKDVTANELYSACMGKAEDVDAIVNEIVPHVGDAFVVRPGLLHSASGHITLAEVSESSDLDFPIFRWGERLAGDGENLEELSLEAAFDFIQMKKYDGSLWLKAGAKSDDAENGTRRLHSGNEFSLTELTLEKALHIKTGTADSFSLYLCVDGEASVQVKGNGNDGPATVEEYIFSKGDAIVVPAEIDDFLVVPRDRSTVVLEAIIEE